MGISSTVLCFEKETIFFDNFKSILPQIVIARTDSCAIAWRFVFALHAFEADCVLVIASDVISGDRFNLKACQLPFSAFHRNPMVWD